MRLEEALERSARFGVKPGLDAIRAVCAAMGDPQDTLRTVHVAGTNGKGAVCAFVDSALRAAGFRTGRYTSPHLVSLNERFFLDGAPVPESTLDSAFLQLLSPTPNSQLPTNLTYFELLTATAFALYRHEKVDYLVLETGLGGRLDATNIVKRPEVCVITRIGLDHCDWLGQTLAEIATEKGGIIKPEVPVVLGAMPDEARSVLEQIAADRHAPCLYAPEVVDQGSVPKNLALGGQFNRENAVTARVALKVLGVGQEAVERGFASVVWPGRYQRIERGGRSFLVDGAHNPPAMRALVDSLKAEPLLAEGGFSVRTVICGFCGDKDVAANLAILREVADVGFAVPIRNPRSLPPEHTASLMRAAGFHSAMACASLREALDRAPGGTVVCGSLFLAGEVLDILAPTSGSRFTPNEPFCSAKRV